MKAIVEIIRLLIPLCMLIACSKDPRSSTVTNGPGTPVSPPTSSPPTSPPPHSLAGKEFIFNDLEWHY